MFGNNPKLPPEKTSGEILKVHSVFLTIQGEGPYSGWHAVFIRLAGCNLACTFCDTDFDEYSEYKVPDLVNKAVELSEGDAKLVVITGGEPFRQKVGLLCESLIKNGFEIQIETNGTLYNPIPDRVKIVCSPKNNGNGYYKVRDEILEKCIGVKFLISESLPDYNDIADVGQDNYGVPLYIHPMDEYDEGKNAKNIRRAMLIAKKRKGILGLQLHKILKID